MSDDNETRDFFVSYTAKDVEWAEWIASTLESGGFSTVFQKWDFRPGTNFAQKMREASSHARHTIAVLSPDYLKSDFAMAEWDAAFAADPSGEQRRLIPARIRACDLKGLQRTVVYIDLVDLEPDDAKHALLQGVSLDRAKPTSTPRFPGPEFVAHDLPAFSTGASLPAQQYDRLLRTVNYLEGKLSLQPTHLSQAPSGSVVTAHHINQFVDPITRLREELGIDTRWPSFPVEEGQIFSSQQLNEISGNLNDVIYEVRKQRSKDDENGPSESSE